MEPNLVILNPEPQTKNSENTSVAQTHSLLTWSLVLAGTTPFGLPVPQFETLHSYLPGSSYQLGSPPPASYPLSHVSQGNGSDVGRGWDWGHSQQVEPAPVNRPGFKLSTLETAGTKVGGQYTAHLGPWKPNLWRAWLISIQIAAYDSMLSTSGQTM